MAQAGKRMKSIREQLEPGKAYNIDEALELLKGTSKVKFTESVDVAIRLGVDPRKSDQAVRGSTVLPNGTGKTVRVAVFAQGENAEKATAAGADIVGISRDSVKSHDNFVAKYSFPFTLLSDKEGAACEAFGAIVEKSMYGRKYMGIDRCTWLFDAKGKLRQVWRGVKVKGHAAEVLAAVKAL